MKNIDVYNYYVFSERQKSWLMGDIEDICNDIVDKGLWYLEYWRNLQFSKETMGNSIKMGHY